MPIYVLYAQLGELDQAYSWLERAFDEKVPKLIRLRAHPQDDPMRLNPRFEDLLARRGLPQISSIFGSFRQTHREMCGQKSIDCGHAYQVYFQSRRRTPRIPIFRAAMA